MFIFGVIFTIYFCNCDLLNLSFISNALISFQMLQSACKGRLTIHRADVMTFYIPEAFPDADVVRWESNGTSWLFL